MNIFLILRTFRSLLSGLHRLSIDEYKKTCIAFIAAFLFLPLSGCAEETASISMVGLNYTSEYIAVFKVNGYGVANVDAHSGGGGFVCCVTVPKRWRPGLKATIRWTKDDRTDEFWKEKVVDIPEYKVNEINHVAVHFFPNGDVKVLVTRYFPGHAKYPYPDPTDGR